ncbi:MAG: large conductance mechanosensitive channel protein MscL [Planctomycetaceae bacterium]|nr:large conductance mechanosensitive channel protein MscL [Planctomycetaceae bacterium]
MGFFKEFRDFAVRGNAIDMAVGVIIGAAFGKVVTSLVTDIVTPLLGLLTHGQMSFSDLALKLNGAENPLRYGAFLDTMINFLIVSFAIFIVIRQINRVRIPFFGIDGKKEKTTKNCPFCCSTISIKATRCPNCTSILIDNADQPAGGV